MHESHYAKGQVIARTFRKAFRRITKYLLFALLVAITLQAQQSSPSAQAWAGVVRRPPANLWPERRSRSSHRAPKRTAAQLQEATEGSRLRTCGSGHIA